MAGQDEDQPFIPKKTLEKYQERQPHLDARNEPYLLRTPLNNHRAELTICSLVYLAVSIMIFVHGDSTLTTYHAWLSGGTYSRVACFFGLITIACSLVGVYASMSLYAKTRYWALLNVFFQVFVIVGSFVAGTACLIHRADAGAMAANIREGWVMQRGNQQGQATLSALQAHYKCCGLRTDQDVPQQPCVRYNPGKPNPGCGATLVARSQTDLLKTGIMLMLSSLGYIYGVVIVLKMTKKRIWSGERMLKQKSHSLADSI